MKKLATLVIMAIASLSAMAQAPEKGELIFDAGIGVGTINYLGQHGTFTTRIAGEYGLTKFEVLNADWTLTIGAQLNNAAHSASGHVFDDFCLIPTVSAHHGIADDLDFYATFGMGYGLVNSKMDIEGKTFRQTDGAFNMALNVGARYWLTDELALNAQLGMVNAAWVYGFTRGASYGSYNILSVGISAKF